MSSLGGPPLTAAQIYASAIDGMIADGRLSKADRSELVSLQAQLGLALDVAQRIYEQRAQERLNAFVNFISSEQRITDLNWQRLHAMMSNFGVKLPEVVLERLHRYNAIWSLENRRAPITDVDIDLQPGEQCHFVSAGVWSEYRTSTTFHAHRTLSTTHRWGKGTSYSHRVTQRTRLGTLDALQPVDVGTLYITSRRLLFTGKARSVSIDLDDIIDFSISMKGISLVRKNGRNPTIEVNRNSDLLYGTLCCLKGRPIPDIPAEESIPSAKAFAIAAALLLVVAATLVLLALTR